MIHWLLLLLLCVLFGILRAKRVSLAHPASLTLIVWISLLFGYKVFNHGLDELSPAFYYALSLYAIPFTLAACFGGALSYPVKALSLRQLPRNYLNIFYAVVIVCLVITIFGFLTNVSSSLSDLLYNARQNALETQDQGALMLPARYYIFEKVSTMSSVFVLLNILYEQRINRMFFVLLGLTFIYFCMRADKTSFLSLGVGLGYVLFLKRVPLAKIALFAGGLLLLLIAVQLIRNNEEVSAIADFLAIYILSPLTAFDLVLNMHTNWITYFPGEHLFWYIGSLLHMLPEHFMLTPVGTDSNFVWVPLPTNVFTVMKNAYMDWGYSGIAVFGAIYGFVWGAIYKASRTNDKYKIFYASCVWMLVMQFFADWLDWSHLIAVCFTLFAIFNGVHLFRKRVRPGSCDANLP